MILERVFVVVVVLGKLPANVKGEHVVNQSGTSVLSVINQIVSEQS
jgi:hypothetical protein